MIVVPGDLLEGGGQILRVSAAFSAVTGKAIRVTNVRAKRSNPGLRAQHLNAVQAVAKLTGARTAGLQIGSKEVEIAPGPPKAGNFQVDVGTAGSTSLVLQALMPAMAFAPGKVLVEVKGGTNNPQAPAIDFLQNVLLKTLSRMGLKASIELIRRGFYPRGQGIVRASTEPVKTLSPLKLTDFGHVTKIHGLSYSSRLPPHIVTRMAKTAEQTLREASYQNVEIELECLGPGDRRCAVNPGCGIILFAELSSGAVMGADGLGEVGKPAERVGKETALDLLKQLRSGAPVDKHLGDQLIVWASLAGGESILRVSELTLHTLTCVEVSQRIVGAKIEIKGEMGSPSTIMCQGVGLTNRWI